MKTFLTLLAAALIAAMAALWVAGGSAGKADESVYDRVIRTGTLRCGYFLYPPVLSKDPNTGEFSGIFYDYLSELGKDLSLKIKWAEEIGMGDAPAALESGRIDAMCAGMWITAQRARANDFVMPLYYLPLYMYAQTGDTRFDADMMVLNDKRYTLAIMEGGATSTLQKQIFPNVKTLDLPQLTSPAELFLTLAGGKADAVIYDLFTYKYFDVAKPGEIRRVSDKPVKVYPNAIMLKRGEDEFRRMLSNTTLEMHLSGAIEKIIKRHEAYEGAVYRVSNPYQTP